MEKVSSPLVKEGHHFTSTELKDHLMNVILPHELLPTTNIPTDPTVAMPTNKVKFKLGTTAPDVNELHATDQGTVNEMKRKGIEE